MKAFLLALLGAFLALPATSQAAAARADDELRARQAEVVRTIGVVRHFHPHDAVVEVDWNGVLLEAFLLAEREQSSPGFADELFALLDQVAPGLKRTPGGEARPELTDIHCGDDEPRIRWLHRGFGAAPLAESSPIYSSLRTGRDGPDGVIDLADVEQQLGSSPPLEWTMTLDDGSKLSLPLVLCDRQARLDEDGMERLAERWPAPNLDGLSPAELARLDVAALWPVLRHFYPYQELIEDWPAALDQALAEVDAVTGRTEHGRLLQRMLFHLQDGHVNVFDLRSDRSGRAWLPIALEAIEGQLYIAESNADGDARPGDRVAVIDDEPAADWLARELAHHSGSPDWRAHRAIRDLLLGQRGESVKLMLARGEHRFEVELTFEADQQMQAYSHPPVNEPVEGIIHVNLDRIEQAILYEIMPRLVVARGVIFDLRGYPSGINPGLLTRLMNEPGHWEGWMQVLAARAPDGDLKVAGRHQWGLVPSRPQIRAPVVFLTNHRAISYAESLLGLVRYHHLGTIVGSHTAGSNGNILPLTLPGGFRVIYTGMRVIGPDGSPFQGQGIAPDVYARPTVQGLKEGRDEVLERALELLADN